MTAPLHLPDSLPRVTAPKDQEAARRAGLDLWHAQLAAVPDPEAQRSRDEQLVAERLRDIAEREQAAVEHWLAAADTSGKPTAVVVHRHEWLRRRIAVALPPLGWDVLDAQDRSTEAVAAVVVHQPQLLLTSDRILGASGLELVRRTRVLSPTTTIVVQVDEDRRADECVEAGAHVVLSHRSSWQELVALVDALAPIG